MTTVFLARSPSAAGLLAAAEFVGELAARHGAELDDDFRFPRAEIAALHESGLLVAPFPSQFGGAGVATGPAAAQWLLPILRRLGAGSLPLGRLYEGHVNAIGLVLRYGSSAQANVWIREAQAGELFGVWAADNAQGLHLIGDPRERRLAGSKILCSGAPFIRRALVTAKDESGRLLMVMPRLKPNQRADLSGWTAQGMRASATGTVNFEDLSVSPEDIIGGDDDYHRQPAFSGGAWRFLAVQQGGMEALLDALREHLVRTERGGDPHQAARLGDAAIAVETARLWVERAASLAEGETSEPETAVAYVNLARGAVERAALALMELAHRSIGLTSFLRPNSVERIARDLATYLRQPGPDRALTSAAAWLLQQDRETHALWS